MLLNKQRLVLVKQSGNLLTKLFRRCNFAKMREEEKSQDVSSLVNKLDSEINEAQASYEPIEQNEKESFLNINKWVLFENENSQIMEMKKSHSEFDISVRFSSKAPEITNQERDDSEPEKFLDFYVTIIRNNQPQGLFIEAVSVDSSVNINQIHFAENVKEYAQKFLSAHVIDKYSGPEFSTLDEKLQQEFLDLFVSLGVNDELGSFIEVMSVDKDERLFLNFMKNVKNTLV